MDSSCQKRRKVFVNNKEREEGWRKLLWKNKIDCKELEGNVL